MGDTETTEYIFLLIYLFVKIPCLTLFIIIYNIH